MGKAPAFQMYAADFLVDTVDWTPAQVGAYFRLLLAEWVNGPLSSNMADLARIAGIPDTRTMYKMWSAKLGKKFMLNGGNLLYNKRLEEEREKQAKSREIQAEKGLSGAKKRWEGHIAPAIAQAQPKHSSSSSSSTSSSFNSKDNKDILRVSVKGFDDWWNLYGRKIETKKCKEYFMSNIKETDLFSLMRGTRNYINKNKEVKFRMYPFRFLKGEIWRDLLEPEIETTESPYRDAKPPEWLEEAFKKGWTLDGQGNTKAAGK